MALQYQKLLTQPFQQGLHALTRSLDLPQPHINLLLVQVRKQPMHPVTQRLRPTLTPTSNEPSAAQQVAEATILQASRRIETARARRCKQALHCMRPRIRLTHQPLPQPLPSRRKPHCGTLIGAIGRGHDPEQLPRLTPSNMVLIEQQEPAIEMNEIEITHTFFPLCQHRPSKTAV
ncbi:hypothetical protein D3C79_488680 [compost metagenome]